MGGGGGGGGGGVGAPPPYSLSRARRSARSSRERGCGGVCMILEATQGCCRCFSLSGACQGKKEGRGGRGDPTSHFFFSPTLSPFPRTSAPTRNNKDGLAHEADPGDPEGDPHGECGIDWSGQAPRARRRMEQHTNKGLLFFFSFGARSCAGARSLFSTPNPAGTPAPPSSASPVHPPLASSEAGRPDGRGAEAHEAAPPRARGGAGEQARPSQTRRFAILFRCGPTSGLATHGIPRCGGC